jgi:anti-sigma factor RsiW
VAQKTKKERQIIRYLLGDLPEEEKTELEERFFSDDTYFEQVLALEDELIDDYVHGELSRPERERFERYFLTSSQRRHRVEFARALMRTVSEAPAAGASGPAIARPEPVWWQALLAWLRPQSLAIKFSLAATALAVVLIGSWLIVGAMRLRTQLEQLQAERQALRRQEQQLQQQIAKQSARSDELAMQLERERDQSARLEQELARLKPSQPFLVSFILSPGLVRDTDVPKRLVIPHAAQQLQLQLDLDEVERYKSYRALLRTAGGDEIWRQDRLQAQPTNSGKAVILRLSSRLFTKGEYILTLQRVTGHGDFEDVDDYHFSVVKK